MHIDKSHWLIKTPTKCFTLTMVPNSLKICSITSLRRNKKKESKYKNNLFTLTKLTTTSKKSESWLLKRLDTWQIRNGNCGWKGGKITSWLSNSPNPTSMSQGIILPLVDPEIKWDSFYQNPKRKKRNSLTHKGKKRSKRKEEENLKACLNKNKINNEFFFSMINIFQDTSWL